MKRSKKKRLLKFQYLLQRRNKLFREIRSLFWKNKIISKKDNKKKHQVQQGQTTPEVNSEVKKNQQQKI